MMDGRLADAWRSWAAAERPKYETCLAEFGDSPEGMDWCPGTGASERFRTFWELASLDPRRRSRFPRPVSPDVGTLGASPAEGSEQVPSIMDVGCGTGQFLDYLRDEEFGGALPPSFEFVGLDYMEPSLDICRLKFAEFAGGAWEHLDLVEAAVVGADALGALPKVDYVTINGMFLAKAHLAQDDMVALVQRVVRLLWAKARCGLAVNVFHDQVSTLPWYTI